VSPKFPVRFFFALSLAAFAASVTLVAHAVNGAIYTTAAGGMLANGNVYASRPDVYLNGGPPANAPCEAGAWTTVTTTSSDRSDRARAAVERCH
jgi:hypothetical protein